MSLLEELRIATIERRKRLGMVPSRGHVRRVLEPVKPVALPEPEPTPTLPTPRDYIIVSTDADSGVLPPFRVFSKFNAILIEVCAKHGIDVQTLAGECRSRPVVLARHEAFYRAANETPLSIAEIGRRLNRDHTSVLHGKKRHAQRIAEGRA